MLTVSGQISADETQRHEPVQHTCSGIDHAAACRPWHLGLRARWNGGRFRGGESRGNHAWSPGNANAVIVEVVLVGTGVARNAVGTAPSVASKAKRT